jgi:hypothetical protein
MEGGFRGSTSPASTANEVQIHNSLETEVHGDFTPRILRKIKVDNPISSELFPMAEDEILELRTANFLFSFNGEYKIQRYIVFLVDCLKNVEQTPQGPFRVYSASRYDAFPNTRKIMAFSCEGRTDPIGLLGRLNIVHAIYDQCLWIPLVQTAVNNGKGWVAPESHITTQFLNRAPNPLGGLTDPFSRGRYALLSQKGFASLQMFRKSVIYGCIDLL